MRHFGFAETILAGRVVASIDRTSASAWLSLPALPFPGVTIAGLGSLSAG